MCYLCINNDRIKEIGLTSSEIEDIMQEDCYHLMQRVDAYFEPLNKFIGPNGPAILKAYRIRKGKT